MKLSADERLDLLAEVAAALVAVLGEDEALEEFAVPLSAEHYRHLRQRDAFVAVMEALPEQQRDELRSRFSRAYGEVDDRDDSTDTVKVPVMPEVKEQVEAAVERVRRAGIVDPEVREACRQGLWWVL